MIKSESKDLQNDSISFSGFLLTVLKGTLSAYIMLIVCFALLSVVYTYTSMPDSFVRPAVNILTIASLIFGGCISAKKAFGFGWLHGAATGFIYTVIRIAIGCVIFGSYVPDVSIASLFAIGVAAATLGGIIGINISSNKNTRR